MSGKMKVKFTSSGLFTTIQDQGRAGHQHLGVPFGGILDKRAYQIVNRLVGNLENTPVLEITYVGPKIHFDQNCIIAISGADLSPHINNVSICMNKAINIQRGDMLSFGKPLVGCRAYLAIQGTWHVKRWLESTSPLGSSNILPENIITKNQILEISTSHTLLTNKPCDISRNLKEHVFNISSGPEIDLFETRTTKSLVETSFEISNKINRMGIRLNHKIDAYSQPHEIISSGIIPGTIQVTHEGSLIILLNDAQTIGGYPRIANIKESMIDQLGQLVPGDKIEFRWEETQ